MRRWSTRPPLSELGAFRPVGIDFLPIDSAQARLFVTDRPADGRARVVIFDVERASGALSRPLFIENESFIRAPNEIAVVSTDAFYFTNTQESRFQWQQAAVDRDCRSDRLRFDRFLPADD